MAVVISVVPSMGNIRILFPVYILSKLFAQMLTSNKDLYKKGYWILLDRFISLVSLVVNITVLVVILGGFGSALQFMYGSNTGSNAYPWALRWSALSVLVIIILNWFFRKKVHRFILKLDDCDFFLKELGLSHDKKSQQLRILQMMAMVFLYTMFVALVTIVFLVKRYPLNILYANLFNQYLEVASQSFTCLTVSCMGLIRVKFQTLNESIRNQFLKSYHKDPSVNSAFYYNPVRYETPRKMVLQYANIHHNLCDCVDSFNTCYSMQVSKYCKKFFPVYPLIFWLISS